MSVEQKLARSLARFQERISNGSFYEAQQTIRSITNRYVHANQITSAISLLYQSTMILLNAKQYDESTDLYLYMLEIMNSKDGGDERSNMEKIFNIINMYPDGNENLMILNKETMKWLSTFKGKVGGDTKLNALLGQKLVQSEDSIAINAGLKSLMLSEDLKSLEKVIEIEFSTYCSEKISFIECLCRVVLPYLVIKNVRFAEAGCRQLLEKFIANNDDLKYSKVEGLIIFEEEEYHLINFLQLLIEILKRGRKEDGNTFTLLLKRYQRNLKEYAVEGLFERVNDIAIEYYDISFIKKQSNLLQDMMGSFLGSK